MGGLGGGADDIGEHLVEVDRRVHDPRDAVERLELGDPALRSAPQPGVLDRLAELGRDRQQQRDLVLVVLPRRVGTHVQRAREASAGKHRDRQDRLERLLVEVREPAEARIEMGRVGDRDRLERLRRVAGDALADAHARRRAVPRDAPDRRAEHELAVRGVELVDEACVGLERRRDRRRDALQHLVELER